MTEYNFWQETVLIFLRVAYRELGTLSILHNTGLCPQDLYVEYKNRGEKEQFFDHFRNTIDASCSHMQRMESLNGWMFVNHISMQIIYKLFQILKTTPLNKKQMLIHRYSINDSVEHLKTIRKIKFAPDESVISEMNKSTKKLLKQMKISMPIGFYGEYEAPFSEQ